MTSCRSSRSAIRCCASAARELSPEELASPEIQAPDRRHDRDDARRRRRRARRQPGRRAAADRGRRGRGDNPRYPYKPPIPLTVFVNPVIEPLDDELVDDQRGLPLGSRPARRGRAPRRTSACATSTATASSTSEVKRGLTAGTFQHEVDHLDGVLFVDRVADPRTLTTWEQFERFGARRVRRADHASSSSGSARDDAYWCELAWLGGERAEPGCWSRSTASRIASVEAGVAAPAAGAERARRAHLPGFANAHSHAFHRALRGRDAARARQRSGPGASEMYELAGAARPRPLPALARATFAEMALAGITAVGEFHYLHHGPGGEPYDDPNEIGAALIEAARRGGHPDHAARRLLPARRHRRAAERGPAAVRRRRRRRLGRAGRRARATAPGSRIGAAIHSVRAVDPDSAATVAAWAGERERPLHAHVSEQPAENEAASPPTARRRRRCSSEAGARSARASPRSTPPT